MRLAATAARLLAALALVHVLASCSGSVHPEPAPVEPGPLSITPDTATLYSETPTTFVVLGGTPPYLVTSSDQATVPPVGTVSANSFPVVPNRVGADTTVTLTVRDSGNAAPVTAALTVKPRTVSNTFTVTPSPGQPGACGTSLCPGGDAEVAVTLRQNDVVLDKRPVQFDVVSGDFRLITSAAGAPEALGLTLTTNTDVTGTARVRIRADNNAASQTALLQATDQSSGSFQRFGVPIAAPSGPLNAQPDEVSFVGMTPDTCAQSDRSAEVLIVGGRAPYTVSLPPSSSFVIDTGTVAESGRAFRIRPTGTCTAAVNIAVVDSLGATVTVTASNAVGELTTQTPPFVVSPQSVTLTSCNQSASVTLAGGRLPGSYFAATGSSAIDVSVSSDGRTASIKRRPGSIGPPQTSPPAPETVQVGFSDGRSVVQVSVVLAGDASGYCPL